MSINEQFSINQFSLVKFEPGQILLLDKFTKKVYCYEQIPENIQLQEQINHQSLLRPIVCQGLGLLYPKGISNLKNQLQIRCRAHSRLYWSQQQLFNTFLPILQCLCFLHKQGIRHGQISLQNIIITNDEEIKLKDWIIPTNINCYYDQESENINDDFIAIGKIMLQCALLVNIKEFNEIDNYLEQIIQKYSIGFFYAIASILVPYHKNFPQLILFLQNDQTILSQNKELQELFNFTKQNKNRKKQISISINNRSKQLQNSNNNKNNTCKNSSYTSSNNSTQPIINSPMKKFMITTPNKKKIKLEDTENKRILNEQVKKKQIDKINKIIERSNAFVNQLMARKNNNDALKKNITKINGTTFYMNNENVQKKTGKDINFSPTKRLKTISRKK